MLKYLKHNIQLKFFIPLILIFSLFHKINSISGTDSEIYTDEDFTSERSNNILCPCDKTAGVCDIGCCCDTDCLDLMLSNDFFNKFECDESSFAEKNKYTKLDYCDDYKESVDDLYNPLVLAFKILKRGFCAVKKNENEEDEQKNYDIKVNNYESQINNDDEEGDFGYLKNENDFVPNLTEFNNFENLKVYLPIALPNGLCLFHSYTLKKNIDYEVTCSYDRTRSNEIEREFGNDSLNKTNNYIHDFYYDQEVFQNTYLKKVEIVYYNNPDDNISYKIEHFYENYDTDINFVDLTVDVKFVNDVNDFKLSGNPGYIKGKKIIFGYKKNDENNIYVYDTGAVFPIEKGSNEPDADGNGTIYFDNYMGNKITFEDLIIYGYFNSNYTSVLEKLFNGLEFSQFGNAKSFKEFKPIYNNKNMILIAQYKDSGTVNNTQFQIYSIDDNNIGNINEITSQNSYNYFIVKFIKSETETEWYYAPGPVIIKLPRNIMYPFKIGTSKYS